MGNKHYIIHCYTLVCIYHAYKFGVHHVRATKNQNNESKSYQFLCSSSNMSNILDNKFVFFALKCCVLWQRANSGKTGSPTVKFKNFPRGESMCTFRCSINFVSHVNMVNATW